MFEERGMNFSHDNEVAIASYYSGVWMNATEGETIQVEQSASECVCASHV